MIHEYYARSQRCLRDESAKLHVETIITDFTSDKLARFEFCDMQLGQVVTEHVVPKRARCSTSSGKKGDEEEQRRRYVRVRYGPKDSVHSSHLFTGTDWASGSSEGPLDGC